MQFSGGPEEVVHKRPCHFFRIGAQQISSSRIADGHSSLSVHEQTWKRSITHEGIMFAKGCRKFLH
jgi:hypothetical protein